MKRRIAKIVLIGACVTTLGVLFWWVTRGNAVWRVHQNYPNAEVRYSPEMSGDLSLDGLVAELIRATGIDFLSGDEPLGITLRDTGVDFSDFRGMTINHMTLMNCSVADIRPLLSEYHPYVTFSHCDLTRLPQDQKKYLTPDSTDPQVLQLGNFFLLDGVPNSYPGVIGLHEYTLFP